MNAGDGQRSRPRILVVEDDRVVREVVVRCLRDRFEVHEAMHGLEALGHIAADHGYVAILCDVEMPYMSGLELLEDLRTAAPALAERFIFITGGPRSDEGAMALDAAGVHVLRKPFSRAELYAAVRDVSSD